MLDERARGGKADLRPSIVFKNDYSSNSASTVHSPSLLSLSVPPNKKRMGAGLGVLESHYKGIDSEESELSDYFTANKAKAAKRDTLKKHPLLMRKTSSSDEH